MCDLRGIRSSPFFECTFRIRHRFRIGDSLHVADEAWIAGAATVAGAATTAAVTATAASTAVLVKHLNFNAETFTLDKRVLLSYSYACICISTCTYLNGLVIPERVAS